MNTRLSVDVPPRKQASTQRASIAVGLAPIFVLLAFLLVIGGVIEPDTGFAIFVACTAWVVYEMHAYQKQIARHDDDDEAAGPLP
jgi:multisubunit Na+/H+ antiporter MnhB subunit